MKTDAESRPRAENNDGKTDGKTSGSDRKPVGQRAFQGSLAENPHGHGEVVLLRDGFKLSRLVLPAGGNLPEHTVADDLVVVVLRGHGTFYVEQEARHLGPGDIVDLVPGEEQAVDAHEELELLFMQVRRNEIPPVVRPLAPIV